MQSEKHIGIVDWFNAKKGYGFISRTGDEDIFVYWSDIAEEGFKTLKPGQEVAFSIGLNNEGRIKATDVVVVKDVEDEEASE